jgi:hypothetical protein
MKVKVANGKLVNHQGVRVRPRDFGGVEGLMYQDTEKRIPSYYLPFVKKMEAAGWKRGVDLFGAPYDWRFAQNRIDDHFTQLQQLIEQVYRDTGL